MVDLIVLEDELLLVFASGARLVSLLREDPLFPARQLASHVHERVFPDQLVDMLVGVPEELVLGDVEIADDDRVDERELAADSDLFVLESLV